MQGCRIGVSPEHHGLIELDDYAGIEELVRTHEGLQGVSLHKPHGVSKLRKGGKIFECHRSTRCASPFHCNLNCLKFGQSGREDF